MFKHHNLISFCIGLVFLIVVQKFAVPEPIFRFLVPAFLIYTLAVTYYNRRYLIAIEKYNIWTLIRPLLLLAGCFGVVSFIFSEFLRGVALILCVCLIALYEIILGKKGENLLLNETLVIAFGIFFTAFAAHYYFPNYGPVFLAVVFGATYLLSRSFYEFTPLSLRTKTVVSIALGLICAEIFWALNFLPPHFSVLALLLFNFFYFCLIINYYHLFHILSLKKIQFHLFFMAVTSVVAIIATRWRVIL